MRAGVEAFSSEQRLYIGNQSKPVLPLKSINFLHHNARKGRGAQERSPAEDGGISGGHPRGDENPLGSATISKFTMQQQLNLTSQ